MVPSPMTGGGHPADEGHALELDARDPLGWLRERFHVPRDAIYMLGNSLGLMSRDAERAAEAALEDWKRLGVRGWLEGEPPWFHMAEQAGALAAGLVGARPDEVVATGTTTVNIHALVSTFHRPEGRRTKILADELNFPSDIYALAGQLRLKGLSPSEHLVLVPSEDGRTLDEGRIVEMMTDEVALVHLPSVLYRSAQLLDVQGLAREARARGIPIGFDCSHSVGVVPHELTAWGVDYAVWCGYKYLCSGPGGSAFLYVRSEHFDREPLMPGWFGYVKERQFDMRLDFEHARSAGGWQISSPSILGLAPLAASIGIILEAGIGRIRERSVRMTSYLVDLVDALLGDDPRGIEVGSPRDPARRGGHVALVLREGARELHEALAAAGVVADFREPGTIRLCPSPLYNTYHEIWQVMSRIASMR
jgi:kynureninase